MSTNEQEKDVSGTGVIPIAANGNQLDSKKVEIMYVIILYVHLKYIYYIIFYISSIAILNHMINNAVTISKRIIQG